MYTLVGVDGNAYAIMGYTASAMKECGFRRSDVQKYLDTCSTGTYPNLIVVSLDYLAKCNKIKEAKKALSENK